MEADLRAKLNQLLGEDRLQEALQILQAESADWGKEFEKDILLISAKLASIRRQELNGTVEKQQVDLEVNRIREALLNLVQTISPEGNDWPARGKRYKQKKRFLIITAACYLLVVAALLFFAFQQKKNIRIEARLRVEQVSFRHHEGSYGFSGQLLSALHIYNYAKLETTARYLQIGQEEGKRADKAESFDRAIVIEPYPDVAGVGVNLGSVVLEELPIPTEALLTMTYPENKLEPFRLTIAHTSPLSGYLNYIGQLEIIAEKVDLTSDDLSYDLFSPTGLQLFAAQNAAHEIKIVSFPGTLSLDLYLRDSLALNVKGLRVGEISFYSAVEQSAVPSILDGEVAVEEAGRKPLKIIRLGEGEALNLIGATTISLDQLKIDEQGIHLSLSGRVKIIESGRNEEIINPLNIEWLLHNQPWWIISFLVILIGIPLSLNAFWKKGRMKLISNFN